MAELLNDGAVLHVRFDGRSHDIPLDDLDVGSGSTDREIKRCLCASLFPCLNLHIQHGDPFHLFRGFAHAVRQRVGVLYRGVVACREVYGSRARKKL